MSSAHGSLPKDPAAVTIVYDDYAIAVSDSTHAAPTPKMRPGKHDSSVETYDETYEAGEEKKE